MARTSGPSPVTLRRRGGFAGRCLPAELARNAGGAEEEDLVFFIVVGINVVAAPSSGCFVSPALTFRADQRLPHVGTLVDPGGGGKMSRRDASLIRTPRRLAFDDATAGAFEGREPTQLHHFGQVTLAIVS